MQPGDIFADRFQLETVAGSGGMGTVWKALDQESGERVALKLLPAQPGWEGERLVREARVLAELHHPGIVRYVAHGTSPEGAPFLAMEWLEGESLLERLGRAGLSVEESLLLVARVADALAAAHEIGVVHRDVKPSNLFLLGGEIGRVRVLDFGIARLTRATVAMTRTGMVLGTPMYMAPEQARGDKEVDPRADVFALGCVLFECLTGQPAFSGSHPVSILARILLEEAARPSSLRPEVSPELDALVGRMLAKAPEERPRDGAAVVAEIERLQLPPSASAAPAAAPARAITTGEQRLLSVVVVAGEPAVPADEGPTLVHHPGGETASLARRLSHGLGAHLEQLADGSLVATLTGGGVATDQAAQAARCALGLHALLPGRMVALATGRGELAPQVPVGEVIERAVQLLRPPEDPSRGAVIVIDAVTAGLLDPRFATAPLADGIELLDEQEPELAWRTLLGRPTPFVGRDRELTTVEAIFAECVEEPSAQVVLVTGPAGIGKSRLVSELVCRLPHHAERTEVWIGRGDPVHAGEPFGMIAPAIRRAAGLTEWDSVAVRRLRLLSRLRESLPSDEVERVSAFIGEMIGVPFDDEHSLQLRAARQNAMTMGDQIRRAFEDWLAAECAQHPVLLVLDGLQWGNLSAVRLIDSALRNLHERPLMVLALARPEVHELFPRLWEKRSREEIRLGGLSRRAGERLVREVLGPEVAGEAPRRLYEQSGGNPFFLEELIRAAGADGSGALPETVLAMLEARLEALPAEARRVLRAASVFGDRFPREGVAALLGELDALEVDQWLLTLADRELLTRLQDDCLPEQDAWVFRHALLRDAVYATLTQADRELGHRLAAEYLVQAGPTEPRALAEHFERGGEPVRALPWCLQAAAQALKGHDFAGALELSARSIELGAAGQDLGRLRLLEAEARHWRGEAEAAEEAAVDALGLLAPGENDWFAAANLLGVTAGRLAHQERLAALAASLEAAVPEAAPGVAAPALAATAVALLHSGRYEVADGLLRLLGDPLAAGDDPYVTAWIERGHAIRATYGGDISTSLKLMEASAAHFELAGDLRTACQQWGNVGFLKRELGLLGEAEEALRGVLDKAERLGLDHIVPTTKHNLGPVLALLGRLEEARVLENEAVVAFARQGDRRFEGFSRIYLARILLSAGDLEGAERQVTAAVDVLEPVPQARSVALAALAEILLRQGQTQTALARAEEAILTLESVGGTDEGESLIRLVLVETRAAANDEEGARSAARIARDALLARADKITDPAWRASFLEIDPDNARTVALAAEWLDHEPPALPPARDGEGAEEPESPGGRG